MKEATALILEGVDGFRIVFIFIKSDEVLRFKSRLVSNSFVDNYLIDSEQSGS